MANADIKPKGFLYSRPVPPAELRLSGYDATVQPRLENPSPIRGFMQRFDIRAKLEH